MVSATRRPSAGMPATRGAWAWQLFTAAVLVISGSVGCAAAAKSGEASMYPGRPSEEAIQAQTLAAPAAPPAEAPAPEPAPPPPVAASAAAADAYEAAGSAAPPAASEAPDEPVPLASEPTQTVVRQPLLIYTATLRLAVYQAEPGLARAEKIAVDAGGYLVRRDNLSIVVRVPAARFKEVLHAMEQLGDVTGREIQAEDVTDEFLDLGTRLRNARAMRDRLQQLLERANTVEDALKVEQELGRLTGEIERLEGRLKLLRELLAFSTVKLEFEPRPVEVVSSRVRLPFPWLNELGLGRLLNLGGGQ
ncbi:MAG: DUF4349 domain-containing protein [Polyangiaceae bacterium]|nr:DUF4349 domain-containing protein [Polyangiaceae bacterium]